MTVRVMGWSGPRNISTAMMRSWENRPDAEVRDEPFYAPWLAETGTDHPARAETLAAHETNRAKVAAACAAPGPQGAPVFYQKQMVHHLPRGADLAFAKDARHFFLIRDPRRVAASYVKRFEDASAERLGFTRQLEIYEEIADLTGREWPVLESETILAKPEAALRALCEAIGIPFSEDMLHWPAGKRASDGAWAAVWYDAVERSTGFGDPSPEPGPLPENLEAIAAEGRAPYEALKARALRP